MLTLWFATPRMTQTGQFEKYDSSAISPNEKLECAPNGPIGASSFLYLTMSVRLRRDYYS